MYQLIEANCDYTSSIATYHNHTLDTQFEIKNEKAILDSVSDQLYFN